MTKKTFKERMKELKAKLIPSLFHNSTTKGTLNYRSGIIKHIEACPTSKLEEMAKVDTTHKIKQLVIKEIRRRKKIVSDIVGNEDDES